MKVILTESQYTKLLLETDKRDIIVSKLGFSQRFADAFHNLSDKYSIWIANSYADIVRESSIEVPEEKRKEYINTRKKSNIFLNSFITSYKNRYEYILDWLKSPRRDQVDLKTLSFSDAMGMSNDWHNSLKSRVESQYKEENEIILDYRDNRGIGYYWANLNTSYSKEECERMGHCGRGQGKLFSLRLINDFGEGQSLITADYIDGVIRDFKGSGNQHPSEKYYKYIIDLLIQKEYPVVSLSKHGYMYETNFKLSDLVPEQLKYVFDNNEALKYDIENRESWPYIIKGIVDNKINTNLYSINQQMELLKFSVFKEKKYNELKKKIRENIVPVNIFFENEVSEKNKKFFITGFGKDVIDSVNDRFDNYNDIDSFVIFLRIVGKYYPNFIDYFCSILSKGFLKFDDKKETFLLNNKINRDVYKCASNIDVKEQYSYMSDEDYYGNYIVRSGSGLFGVVNGKNKFIIEPKYLEIGTQMAYYILRTVNDEYIKMDYKGNKV